MKKFFLFLVFLLMSIRVFGVVPTGWSQVTSLSGITAGDKIIIVTNNGSNYFNGTQSSGHFQVTALSTSAPASASSAGVIELVSTGSSNTYKLKLVSTNKYVIASAAKSGSGIVNSNSDDSGWTFSSSSGTFNAQYQKTGQQAYCRSYSNNSFRTYANTSNGATFQIYKYSSASSHTLSSAVSPAASGSVSLSATSVAEGSTATATAIPADHYTFTSWSISGTGASLSSTTTNPTTITMGTANAIVTATFAENPKASITLCAPGDTTTDNTTYYVGDEYTLPTSTDAICGTKVLVGWSTVEVAETDTKPTSNYYEKGAEVTLSSSQTFYAVFAIATGTPESWDPVTSAQSDWSGEYVIVNPGGTHAMTSDFYATGEFLGASVTITNNKVVSPTDKMIWVVEKNGNNSQYSFKNKSTNSYADITANDTKKAGLNENAVWFTIESTGTSGVWDVVSVSYSARCFSWYSTNTSFRTYAKSDHNTGYLYKKSGGTTYSAYSTSCSETPTTYDITFRDIHNNKWTQKTTENNDTIFFNDTVPSDACRLNGWVFAGWSIDSLDETKIIKDSSYIIPTKNDTLYAFYRLDSLKSCYKLVESDLGDWSGEYLIVSGDSVAFDGSLSTLDVVGDTIKISVSNKLIPISVKTESSKFIITKKSGGYSILSASGTYIGKTANSNGLDTNESDNYTNTISFDDGITNIIGSGGAYLRYNAASDQNRFRYYKSSTYTDQKPIQLYKKQSGTSEYSSNPQCFGDENTIRVAEWFEDSVKFDIGDYESIYIYDGTLNSFNSCDSIRIKITNDNDENCIRWFQVPIFAGKNTSKNDCNCDVVVLHDSTFTVSNNMSNSNVYVYGTLIVNANKTYTINSLTLRRDNDSVPQLLYNGTLNIKNGMFFEMRTNGEDWRWLTLPDSIRLKPILGKSESIMKYYDGETRANYGRGGWKVLENDTTFGFGVIFGIDKNEKRIYTFKLDTNILSLEKGRKRVYVKKFAPKSEPKNDMGWNLIGNPYMFTYNINPKFGTFIYSDSLVEEKVNEQWTGRWIIEEKNLRYIVVPSNKKEQHIIDAGGYEQICLQNGYKLKPFTSFFVQSNKDDSLIFYIKGHIEEAAAPKRIKESNKNSESFLQLQIGSLKTGCYISNKFTDDYEIGDDMESLYQTYQLINDYKLLYSAINDSIINSGIHIYTNSGLVSLDDKTDINDFEEISIFYNGNWYDLLQEQTVNVNGEFILQARRKQADDIPTDIEMIIDNNIEKFIQNNTLYIKKNNHIYNILGGVIK